MRSHRSQVLADRVYRGAVHFAAMITGFRDKATERVWLEEHEPSFGPDLQRQALRRLQRLHAAVLLEDLRALRGNRLERLRGDRQGQWSIRVNDQWRICFVWEGGDAREVEITDYH